MTIRLVSSGQGVSERKWVYCNIRNILTSMIDFTQSVFLAPHITNRIYKQGPRIFKTLLLALYSTSFNLQAPCVLYIGQAFCYTSENAFYIFKNQIYFIIRYLLDRASLI